MIMYNWSTKLAALHASGPAAGHLAVCSDADLQAGSQYELKSYSAGVQCLVLCLVSKYIQACRLTKPQLRSSSDATPPVWP
jgi:hypothetical protein